MKIGYTRDIDRRLNHLNSSECIPFAFRVYATCEVPSSLSDLKIHSIIDKLNPNLRSAEKFNGKQRVREFYVMSPEDAYSILEAVAEIHNCGDKLKKAAPTEEERSAEQIAQEIDTESTERAEKFSFSKCQIPVGSAIEYCADPNIVATVADDKNVKYNGETMSLTALAKLLSGKKYAIAGPRYFKYKGEWLNDIRCRLGV
ncbi:MAG: GIY-YIG nuclease family protein [Succinimonas sp.]|nr:GIY-YIG nuclease family protein [Succinimonas sp.]